MVLQGLNYFAFLFIFFFDQSQSACNYGVFWDLPFLEGICNTCSGESCHGVESIKIICSNDSNSATAYTYNDTYCGESSLNAENTIVNETALTEYECGNTGACQGTEYYKDEYLSNNECSGPVNTSYVMYLTPDYQICSYDENTGYVVGTSYKANGIKKNYYSPYITWMCNGSAIYSEMLDNYECSQESNKTSIYSGLYKYGNDNRTTTTEMPDTDDTYNYWNNSYDDYGCNYGIYDNKPLVSGSCNNCDGECGGIGSMQVVCSDDGTFATLYSYNDTYCYHSINEMNLTDFECNKNDDYCSSAYSTSLWYFEYSYLTNDECNGYRNASYYYNVASSTKICVYDESIGYYMSYYYFSWGVYYQGYYNDSNCEYMRYAIENKFGTLSGCVAGNTADGNNNNTSIYYDLEETYYDYNETNETTDGCNWGLYYDSWPIVENECHSCEGSACQSGHFPEGSFKMKCTWYGTGMIYYYGDSNECDGNITNMTELNYYQCSNNGNDCSVINMNLKHYGNNNTNCNNEDSLNGEIDFILANLTNYCVYSYNTWQSININVNFNSLTLDYYDDNWYCYGNHSTEETMEGCDPLSNNNNNNTDNNEINAVYATFGNGDDSDNGDSPTSTDGETAMDTTEDNGGSGAGTGDDLTTSEQPQSGSGNNAFSSVVLSKWIFLVVVSASSGVVMNVIG